MAKPSILVPLSGTMPEHLTAARLGHQLETPGACGSSPLTPRRARLQAFATELTEISGWRCTIYWGPSPVQPGNLLLVHKPDGCYTHAYTDADLARVLHTLGMQHRAARRRTVPRARTGVAPSLRRPQEHAPTQGTNSPPGEYAMLASRVLIIDDDASLCEALTVLLEDEWEVYTALKGQDGLTLLVQEAIPVVVLDLRLPDIDGLTLLEHLKASPIAPDVLVLTAVHDTTTVVRAMQHGATDYLTKPFDGDVLREKLRLILTRMRARFPALPTIIEPSTVVADLVMGPSPAMRHVWETLQQIADTTATVLLLGESGTGKSQLAHAVHRQSVRRDRPFVTVHCGNLTEALATNTLFGHERGAFTGAERRSEGAFERAHTGTLFLDEVGSLPLPVQGMLLHVLQEQAFERVGGETTLHVDVRVIAASNQDLGSLVAAGTFREDLFYRLNVVAVHIPPLRDRRSDIPLLVATLLAAYNTEYHRTIQGVTTEAMQVLRQYAWPGNVRQLENMIARLVALNRAPLITLEDVQIAWRESEGQGML